MDAPLGARTALLQALVVPGYGAGLIDRVRRATHGLLRMSMGSLYPALARLERERLVRSRLLPGRRGAGRPRRYFELTVAGVAARQADRRAVAALFRMDAGLPGRDLTGLISRRLHRCAAASASVRRLRQRVLEEQGEE